MNPADFAGAAPPRRRAPRRSANAAAEAGENNVSVSTGAVGGAEDAGATPENGAAPSRARRSRGGRGRRGSGAGAAATDEATVVDAAETADAAPLDVDADAGPTVTERADDAEAVVAAETVAAEAPEAATPALAEADLPVETPSVADVSADASEAAQVSEADVTPETNETAPEQTEVQSAPAAASSWNSMDSWTTGRPFVIGADGRVRYLDEPEPEPATPVATEPSAPAESAAAAGATVPAAVTAALTAPESLVGAAEPALTPPVAEAFEDRFEQAAGEQDTEIGLPPSDETVAAAIDADIAASVRETPVDEDEPERALDTYPAFVDEVMESAIAGDAVLEPGNIIIPPGDDREPGDEGLAADEAVSSDEALRRRRRSRRGGRNRRRRGEGGEGDAQIAAEGDLVDDDDQDDEPDLAPESEPERAPFPTERAHAPAPVAPAARSSGGQLSPLEGLIARQNVVLDQLLQRQSQMTRTLERTLEILERRLADGGQARTTAMPRTGIFVDVPNIMYAAERYNVQVDFGRLLEYMTRNRTLIRASAYAPISDDPTIPLSVQRFVAPFVNHGYRIVTKPLKRFADGSIKANFDIEMAMDVLTMAERLDIVVMVTGDGDFRRLCELVESKGVRVEVVAFAQSTAAELRAIADDYIDLTMHLKDLCIPIDPRYVR